MGKKGGAPKVEVTKYFMSQHFGICAGADAITRVTIKEKVAWEGEYTSATSFVIDRGDLFGHDKKEGGVEAVVYWLPGASDQVLPDLLAQKLGRANGADAPGYRGVASAFFVGPKGTPFANYSGFGGSTIGRAGAYWSANNPYLPGVWITVRRAPVGLTAELALVPRPGAGTVTSTVGTFDVDAVTNGATTYAGGLTAGVTVSGFLATDIVRLSLPEGETFAAYSPWGVPSPADPGGHTGSITRFNVIPDGEAADGFQIWDGSTYDGYEAARAAFGTVQISGATEYTFFILDSPTADNSGGLSIKVEKISAVKPDANPAHIIYECLTNTDWGMGSPSTAIDVASFENAAITLYAEGFGLSMIWTRQASIQDFIQEVLDHIQAVLYVDPATGLLTLKLIRADYDPDTLPELNPDNADLTNFARKLWGEITNEIVVTWTNPENEQDETVTVQDLASLATQGGIVSDSRNYYGVRYANLAAQLAQRDLRSAGAPLASFEVEVDRTFWNARPAGCAKVVWPEYGLDGVVCRVTSVDYGRPGDPTIKLSMIEDVFALDAGDYVEPPTSGWEDPGEDPEPIATAQLFTLPLFFAANSPAAGFVDSPEYPEVVAGVLATTEQEDAWGYQLWDEVTLSNGDLEWQEITQNNIIGHATLADALVAEVESADVAFGNLIGDTVPRAAGFVVIGDGEETENEIAQIDAVDGTYELYVLRRGVLDTVPRDWPDGTPVWFVDEETLFEDPTVRSAGETMDVKLLTQTSKGTLDLADAALVSATLTDRPWLPNRPANVQVDSVLFNDEDSPVDMTGRPDPWVTISWANRNRLLEDSQVLAWDDATVTPETGQTTKIEVYASDGITLLDDHPGETGTSFDVPDASFSTEGKVLLKVIGERTDADGDFVSLQAHGLWVRVRGNAEFTQDVANYGFVGNALGPAGFYDAVNDQTWEAWEAWNGIQRVVMAHVYAHATEEYSAPFIVSTTTLTNDGHGVPAIVMDHEGYVHCFFGAHNSPMRHCVTASPRDPSEWVALADIGSDTTYAHPVRMGTALYLFVRANGAQELHRYKTTALSGGIATWGAAKAVAAFTGGRFYLGQALASGTTIHLIATYADNIDTFRRDIYHIAYDSTDESADNSNGSVSTAVGSQPISKATADASYIVVNQTTNETDVPAACITPDGKLHIAYLDGTATPWPVKHQSLASGVWSGATSVTTISGSNTIGEGYKEEVALVPMADNSVELYYPDDPSALYAKGGDMMRMVRTSGGVWGSATTIKVAVGPYGYARPMPILNADPDLRVMFTEETATELDADAGGLKAFGYGANGFVGAHAPVFTSLPVISNIDGFFAEGDVLDVTSGDHNGTSSAYQWKRDGVAIGGETGDSYTLDAADVGTLITVTQTASNFVGDTSSTSAAVGPIGTPTFATQTRTLSDSSNRTLSDTTDRTMSNRTA